MIIINYIGNGPVQRVKVEESIRNKCIFTYISSDTLTIVLLNPDIPCFENSVDPASAETN